MPLMWAAKCRGCGRISGVRPSNSTPSQIDMVAPSEKFNRECPHCKFKNVFLGSDLKEVDAAVLSDPPPSKPE